MAEFIGTLPPGTLVTIGLLLFLLGVLTGVVLSHVQQRKLDDRSSVRRGDWPGHSAMRDRAAREERRRYPTITNN